LATPRPDIGLENAVIPADEDEAEIQIQPGPELKPGNLVVFQIRSEAAESKIPSSYTAPVHTEPALRSRFPLMHHPPMFLDGRLTLVVTERQSE
jgi:hypothetical protein